MVFDEYAFLRDLGQGGDSAVGVVGLQELLQRDEISPTCLVPFEADRLRRLVERREIRQQSVESAALAYYYAMVGLSMSLKLYSREELERDITLVWGGLEQGLRKEAQKL